jgi:hypothetical protein
MRKRVPLEADPLFEHADALIGNHRDETDLRRAVSAACYGLSHFILRSIADWAVGPSSRSTPLYGLVYQSVDHKPLNDLCRDCLKATPSDKIKDYVPAGGFGEIAVFARLTANLYGHRILADYHRDHRFSPASALLALEDARNAVKYLGRATLEQRKAFMTLLLPFKRRPPP